MKRRRTPFLLKLINLYNGFLAFYLILRAIFDGEWWWLGLLNTFALWLFMPLLMLIPLALLLRGKRTAALSLCLALLGFWKFAPMADRPPSSAPQDFRVLAFNVWKDNSRIDKTVDWILAQNADILILEEFVEENLPALPRVEALYPFYVYTENQVKLFSRYPIEESEIFWVETPGEGYDGRRAVRAVINIKGRLLSVYGAHFNTPRSEDFHFGIETEIWPLSFFLRYDETHRNRQIRNLAAYIAHDPNPVILAGDFNTSHTSTIVEEFSSIGLADSFTEVGGDWGMTWPYLSNKIPPLIRIDYIWSSRNIEALRFQRGGFQGSDHSPVIADFAFSE